MIFVQQQWDANLAQYADDYVNACQYLLPGGERQGAPFHYNLYISDPVTDEGKFDMFAELQNWYDDKITTGYCPTDKPKCEQHRQVTKYRRVKLATIKFRNL